MAKKRTKDTEFTGKSLESALNDETLGNMQSTVALTGMVKKSEQKGYVSFTQAGCDSWVDLPVEMIERAEYLQDQTCKDHSHPLMEISFKQSEKPEHNVLLALLGQASKSRSTSIARREPTGNHGSYIQPMGNTYAARIPGGFGSGTLRPPGLGFIEIDCDVSCKECCWTIPGTNRCVPYPCDCKLSDCGIVIKV